MNNSDAQLKRILIKATRDFLRETGAQRASRAVHLHAVLLDDLGLGSLERVMLLRGLEKRLALRIPVEKVMAADTLRDVYHILQQAHAGGESELPDIALDEHLSSGVDADAIEVKVDDCTDLIMVFKRYCELDPERVHAHLLQPDGGVVQLTYIQLWQRAEAMAVALRQQGLQPKSVVAVALQEPEAFMVSYLALLMIGCQPLVMRMPANEHCFRPLYWRIRLPLLLANHVSAVLLQDRAAQSVMQPICQILSGRIMGLSYQDLQQSTSGSQDLNLTPVATVSEDIMYHRLSWSEQQKWRQSLTHAQWLQQTREDGQALQVGPTDVVLSWLSLVEPMGLLSAWLGSLYHGLTFIWMPPHVFLSDPLQWLRAIHKYRASISFAPNSGYALCVDSIPASSCTGLDLSCWRVALNAGEYIAANTVRQFCDFFKNYGLAPTALRQGYIPAGESMLLTLSASARAPHFERISASVFYNSKRAQRLPADMAGGLLFVAAGKLLPSGELSIRDGEGRLLADRHVGTVYYRRDYSADKADWVNSGDVGYIVDQTLYVVAPDPSKVVKHGSYITEYALRLVIQGISALDGSQHLSFCVTNNVQGKSCWIIILATTKHRNPFFVRRIKSVLMKRLAQCFGVVPDHILLRGEAELEYFGDSREEQIQAAHAAYLSGTLIPATAWYHHRRMFAKVSALLKTAMRPARWLFKVVYTVYFALIMLVLFLPTWCIVMSLPKKIGKVIFKVFCRLVLILAACPVLVSGKKWLKNPGLVLFAPNHTSYLDVLALSSVLPASSCFVGKRELKGVPLLGSIFKKMGHLFVDPTDFTRGEENLAMIVENLNKGYATTVYPEGTFTHADGLRPFKLGAFMAASQAEVPVCPVICKGLRKVLRDREVLLRPGVVRIIAKEWLYPQGSDLTEVIALRDKVHAEIAADCDEPVLDIIAAGPPVAD